jgi:hypothetical protein
MNGTPEAQTCEDAQNVNRSIGIGKRKGNKSQAIDEIGNIYGKLRVIGPAPKRPKSRLARWECVCDCGKKTITTGNDLRNIHTQSCGCSRKNKTGENHGNWRGGRWVHHTGYVYIVKRGHPNANKRGHIPENIFVMSEYLGRPLDTKTESVHHKNGIRSDNSISNLELRCRYHGYGQTIQDTVAYAVNILRRYSPDVLSKDLERVII